MKRVVIVSAVRTPIGNFGGALSSLSAVDLGRIAATEAIRRAGIAPSMVEEVLVGNILSAGLGQNIARQIGIHSGVPDTTPAMTINQLCGSGLRAVMLGAQLIALDEAEVVLAGGTESMSNAPYLLPKARFGYRLGDGALLDSILTDGLTDVFNKYHMGMTAENIAEQWEIGRPEQDEFALESQLRAEKAQKEGRFSAEIIPVTIPQRKGEQIVVDTDEYPKHGMTIHKLSMLSPAFKKDGTVTAGNASGINDGAAMLVLMCESLARKLDIIPLAFILAGAYAALDPKIMGYGPVPATQKVLGKAKLTIDDIDLVEANEAFAAQSLAVVKDLNIDINRVNVNGGAIALGHPVGASGARVLTTLLYEMQRRNSRRGLATLCIGGGQGIAMIVERNV